MVHAVHDLLPAYSRCRRRRHAAGRHDHRGRPIPGTRTRQGAGVSGQCLGRRGRARTLDGRTHRSLGVMGLDLLDQHSSGLGCRGWFRGIPQGQCRTRAPLDRHRRYRDFHGRSHITVDRAHRSRQPPSTILGGCRTVLHRGRGIRSLRAPCHPSGRALCALESPTHRGNQRSSPYWPA